MYRKLVVVHGWLPRKWLDWSDLIDRSEVRNPSGRDAPLQDFLLKSGVFGQSEGGTHLIPVICSGQSNDSWKSSRAVPLRMRFAHPWDRCTTSGNQRSVVCVSVVPPSGTGPALGDASNLINQEGSRVGMLAITHCERAQGAQIVTRPNSETCCSQTWLASPSGGPWDTNEPWCSH